MTSADLPPANGQIYAARSVIYKPQSATPSSDAVTGELVYNSSDSSYYYYNGSAWAKLGGGWYVPSSIKSSAVHAGGGNFGGYSGMYTWIQTNGCAGYHVCDETEVVRYAQMHANTLAGGCQGWVAHGGVNVDPQEPSDCWNFTSTSGTGHVGFINHPAGYHGTLARDTCASAGWGVLCCK